MLADGSAGGVVVTGAAGVGKTRLAVEASRLAESAGHAVVWVRATRSAAAIPLGALAALLPEPAAGSDAEAGVLGRARRALVERAGERRLVLCVDDGQWLDDVSAALVHQLAAAGDVFAVVTSRQGEPVPDALRALWKDELCALVELEPLTREDVERLLAAVLGAPVDGRSANALWELTRGNALFLRELVRYGLDRRVLAEDGGVWRWRGGMAVGTRLSELLGARLDALEASARRLLEVVALAAPLEVGLLEPRELATLDALEAQELVRRRTDGRRRLVDLAHPLHGEVMRARTTRTRSESVQRRLADAVRACGARRRGDLLRVAAWRLEVGAAEAPELFERAAAQALAALDWSLATRLARAALQAGGGRSARLALARARAGAGEAIEAEALLAALDRETAWGRERVAVAIARARNLYWGLDRARDAEDALTGAERAIADPALRDELAAARAWLACGQGLPRQALAAATAVLERGDAPDSTGLRAAADPALEHGAASDSTGLRAAADPALEHGAASDSTGLRAAADPALEHGAASDSTGLRAAADPALEGERAPDAPRVRAAVATAMALAMRGRSEEAIAVAERWQPAAERRCDALPLLDAQLLGARASALLVAGRLVEASGMAERMYERDVGARSHENTAVSAFVLGSAWLARGRVRTALRWFRESVALLRENDAIGFLVPALAGIVQAAAQAGDGEAAQQGAEAMARAPRGGNRLFGNDRDLSLAWSAAAGGELSRARTLALGAAEQADARGQDGFAVRALHDACRLGEPAAAAAGLAELARRVDGAFAAAGAEHAAARVAGDGARLLAVAERFAEIGAMLLAAEAADAAAAAHRRAGRATSARAAGRRAAVLLERCEGARPVTLLGGWTGPRDELTPREYEIAALAARGLTSREIADRLVVSVRTVDNTLLRVYRKLGISARGELAGLLTARFE